MKITKLGRGISATIEEKTSQAGNQYEQASICKSSKGKSGEWEKEYLNMFPNDLPELIQIATAVYAEYITAKTSKILGETPKPKQEQPVEDDDFDEEIPF